MLYKAMFLSATEDKEKKKLLVLAEAAISDAYTMRIELLGDSSKEIFESQIQFASILSMKGR